jgi:hypothetical protein
MRVARTNHFLRSYHKAPADIRRAFDKQVALLVENLNHPSFTPRSTTKHAAYGRRV